MNILSNLEMKVAVKKFQELCGKEVLYDCYLVTAFRSKNVRYTFFFFFAYLRIS